MITNKELEGLVIAYQSGKISKALMRECFIKLASHVYDSYSFKFRDRDNLMKETANLCLEKVKKFDISRGKAFNFFVTIIMCFIRQVTRTEKKLYGMDGNKWGKA